MHSPGAASFTRRRPREIALATITVVLSCLSVLMLAEIALRCLPVHENLSRAELHGPGELVRYAPNRDVLYSHGWNFDIVNRVHINNEGMVNDQDYRVDDPRPLVAVIGDSFVEALQVPFASSFHGKLADALQSKLRVYSFGISGAPMSQYMQTAGLVARKYTPDYAVVVMVNNDFDESLLGYQQRPGFYYYRDTQNVDLVPVPFHRSSMREFIKHSALARYLFNNLMILELNTILRNKFSHAQQDTGMEERVHDSQEVTELFLANFDKAMGLPKHNVVFVLDTVRPQIYSDEGFAAVDETYAGKMFRYFKDRAEALGYAVVDMKPVFAAEHRSSGKRFEFASDGHWNEDGHDLVFRTVMDRIASSWSGGPLASRAPAD